MNIFIFFFLFLLSIQAHSSACCAGSSQVPGLILGDEKTQLTTSFMQSSITDDVSTMGIWRKRSTQEISQTIKLETAHLITDAIQLGLVLPMTQNFSTWKFGDTNMVVGFEGLPEYEYSIWKPKGHIFINLTVPTGSSVYDGVSGSITGRGFWNLGLGIVLSKIIDSFDFQIITEIHKAFDKQVGSNLIVPGWGYSASLGGGYSIKKFRSGAALTMIEEGGIDTQGVISAQGSAQKYVNAAIQISYLLESDWSASLAYSDQKWFGTPSNTTLGTSMGLSLTKRWQR